MIEIDKIVLQHGDHPNRDAGLCFMEAVAWIAGEAHSDHPVCVCPVLGSFLRSFNDHASASDRQLLKPYLRLVIGTGSDGLTERRGWMCVDWIAHEYLPLVLDLAGLRAESEWLRKTGAIHGLESLENMGPVLDEIARRAAARAARAARAALAARYRAAEQQLKASLFQLLDRMVTLSLTDERPENLLVQPAAEICGGVGQLVKA
jgi:hypothetical protein